MRDELHMRRYFAPLELSVGTAVSSGGGKLATGATARSLTEVSVQCPPSPTSALLAHRPPDGCLEQIRSGSYVQRKHTVHAHQPPPHAERMRRFTLLPSVCAITLVRYTLLVSHFTGHWQLSCRSVRSPWQA